MYLCDLQTCGRAFHNNDCKCYVNMSLNPTKEQMYENQICAYESKDGFIYPCDPGCCKAGCPGQCPRVTPRPPEGTHKKRMITEKEQSIKVYPLIYTLLIVMFILLLASVASLWNGLKQCPSNKI